MELRQVAQFSMHNRLAVKQSQVCGCYYCMSIFSPQEIKTWTDEADTAICPHCSIDAVLPETTEFHVTKENLQKLHKYWF